MSLCTDVDVSRKITSIIGLVRQLGLCPAFLNLYTQKYSTYGLVNDIIAGLRIFLLATPIAMALAFFCGLSPTQGVLSFGAAAAVGALLGGSKYQISTISMPVAVLALDVLTKYQYKGLLVAAAFAAIMLIMFGMLRLNDTVKHVARSFIAALTAYVAAVIAMTQIQYLTSPAASQTIHDLIDCARQMSSTISSLDVNTVTTALAYLAPLVLLKIFIRGAAPYLIYLVLGAAVTYLTDTGLIPMLAEIKTVGKELVSQGAFDSIATIAKTLPPQTVLSNVLTYSFAIALIIATQTCFATNAVSSMTGDNKIQHNAELIATGAANFASVACGGLFVAPDVPLSLTNVAFRARTITPIVIIATMAWYAVMYGDIILRYLPINCLSCLLIVYTIAELGRLRITQYLNPRSRESCVFWVTMLLALYFGFIPAAIVGFTISNMFFAKRMVNIKDATVQSVKNHDLVVEEFMANKNRISNSMKLPRSILERVEVIQVTNVLLLNIAGIIEEAMERNGKSSNVLIIYFKNVPYLDGEGMTMLKRLASNVTSSGGTMIVTGTNGMLLDIIQQKANEAGEGNVYGYIIPNFGTAIQQVVKRLT
ncbi:MAG: hypothetical protein LBJ69_02770 [Holosporales bacterium]|nr:hypothetical protein [Holosporales bacterium]